MSNVAIQARDVSKLYLVGQPKPHDTLRDLLAEAMSAPLRRRSSSTSVPDRPKNRYLPRSEGYEQLWALRDVCFQVHHGEVVGIIGSNGAGKSTLLKILSRVTEPTSGHVELRGRLGSLLEVGAGFHPELTGRENVYLNGAILGMKRIEIQHRFDEIVAFSELERFIDTPLKRYSTGMYMRLAFAVAAHLEPDILIVDEVLAVGDASFQRKCLGKIGNVSQTDRTVLFVSHNMLAIEDLCDRVLWLKDGHIVEEGQPKAVISSYLQESFSTDTEKDWKDRSVAPGNHEVRLHRACIRPAHGSPTDPITVRTPFAIEFEYWKLQPNVPLSPSLVLYNEQGIVVFTSGPPFDAIARERKDPAGLYRHTCWVPEDLLNDGVHRVTLYIGNNERTVLQQDDILVFEVQDVSEMRHGWYGKWGGAVRPMLKWSSEFLNFEC